MRFPKSASPRTATGAHGASQSDVAIPTRGVSQARHMGPSHAVHVLLTLVLSVSLTACGGPDPLEVSVARVVRPGASGGVPVPPDISPAERLGLARAAEQGGGKPRYEGTVPTDWKPLAVRPGQMRDESYEVPGDPPAEVIVLVDRLSPLLANINRWRGQMGAAPLAESELESLVIEAAGQTGYLVDVAGTFSGMGGGERKDQRFIGLIVQAKDHTLSVRLLGAKATVDTHASGFRDYVASLRLSKAAAHGGHAAGGHAAGGHGAGPSTAPAADVRWTLPSGWVEEPPTGGPRIMSFRVPGVPEPGLDIALMRFADTAGGLGPTLEMWAGNAGRPPLEKDEIGALERFPLLGSEAVFVDMRGAKVLEAGKDSEPTMLLACLVYLDDGVIVARVWAREADLEPQREAFIAFCKSWRRKGDAEEAPK
ncbi:MAG: hypothetical protein GY946_31230 [bacterium]|nr:hypothetical protein [bacterium]